jgi:hypothetical protein
MEVFSCLFFMGDEWAGVLLMGGIILGIIMVVLSMKVAAIFQESRDYLLNSN